jgi:hypothetical protein
MAIELLTAEEVGATEIHRRPNSVRGEHTVGVSAVRRCVGHFKSDETEIGDKRRSGRPATAVTRTARAVLEHGISRTAGSERVRIVGPNRNTKDVLLLHDNARPHSSMRTSETIE